MGKPPAGNIARLSVNAAPSPFEPFVVMGIMNLAGDNVAGVPGEGRVASLHDAIHLVTAVNLGDACPALGAGARLGLDRLGRLHRIGIARVFRILLEADYDQTIGAGPLFAGSALVGGGEKAATVLIGAFHHKLAACGACLRAVIQLLILPHVTYGRIQLCRLG